HIFGRVVRLPDNALCVAAYVKMEGNETRLKEPSRYVQPRTDGTAPEAREEVLDSSLLFLSTDEGKNWEHVSTIGKIQPGRPFDGGKIYSEGFNETGLSVTSDGNLYALMRHGSYMLLWSAVSEDNGRSWSDVQAFNHPGVAPSLSLLPNGVLAAVWGRPGLTVGFSLDGTGTSWDLLVGVMGDGEPSQKYGWLVPAGENRLMLFYDRREWDPERRTFFNHGIYHRTIEVNPGPR
ncbi:MAG: sialidase family protein, partial [Candidatus Latescibacteria bacterium]|nr:sialidase family protein [Candidatus Latescibacterota bacterium]